MYTFYIHKQQLQKWGCVYKYVSVQMETSCKENKIKKK